MDILRSAYLQLISYAIWCENSILNILNPIHIDVTTDQLLLEERFFIDIKFDLDQRVFPGMNHILQQHEVN